MKFLFGLTFLLGVSFQLHASEVHVNVCGINVQYDRSNVLSYGETGEFDTSPRLQANLLSHELNTSKNGCLGRLAVDGRAPQYDECAYPRYFQTNSVHKDYSVDEEIGETLILVEVANSESLYSRFLYRDASSGASGIIAIEKNGACVKSSL